MRIQEIMSKPAITCRITDSMSRAAELMWRHDCGAIPVTSEDGTLIGMITDRDACMAAYTQGKALHELAIGDAMAKQVYSCHAEDPLDVAERLMSEKKVRRLPVVNSQGRPIGVVSMNDLTRAAASNKKAAFEHEVLSTLAAISQPRPHPVPSLPKATAQVQAGAAR